MNKKEYIKKLYEFTERKNTTIYNYYKKLAILCRKHKEFEIIGFEANNPFLTPADYKLLLDSSDELMPEFFARAMVKVVSFNELIFAEEEKLAKQQAEQQNLSLSIIKELINEEYEKVEEREQASEKEQEKEEEKEQVSEQEVKKETESASTALTIPSSKGLMVIEPKCTALVPVKKAEQPKKGLLSRDSIKNIIEKAFYKESRRDEKMPREIAEQYLKMQESQSTALVPVEEEVKTEAPEVKETAETPKKTKGKKADKKSAILDRLINRSNSRDKVATVLEKLTKGTEEPEEQVIPELAAPQEQIPLALPAYKEPVVESTALVPAQVQTLVRRDIIDSINQAMENIAVEEETSLAVVEQPKKKKLFNFTSINLGIIEKLKGLALIRESKTGKADIYYHNPNAKTLKGRTQVDGIKADSGYYVNYQEYIFKMIAHTMNKYPNASELRFVNEDGEEKSISEVVEEVFRTLRAAGSIRFGSEYANAKIDRYSDLRKIKPGYGKFANENLKKGIYVRRDILRDEFKKYKLRFVMQNTDTDEDEDEDKVTYKKTK